MHIAIPWPGYVRGAGRGDRRCGSDGLKDPPCREYDLQSPLTLELAQIPPEERRVANELVRSHFEQDDHPRLVELAGAPIHRLHPAPGSPPPPPSPDHHAVSPRQS